MKRPVAALWLLSGALVAGCTSTVSGQPAAVFAPPPTSHAAIAPATPHPAAARKVTVKQPGLVPIAPSYDVEMLTLQRFTAKEITLVARVPPGGGQFTCFFDAECAFGRQGDSMVFVAHRGAKITINNLYVVVAAVGAGSCTLQLSTPPA